MSVQTIRDQKDPVQHYMPAVRYFDPKTDKPPVYPFDVRPEQVGFYSSSTFACELGENWLLGEELRGNSFANLAKIYTPPGYVDDRLRYAITLNANLPKPEDIEDVTSQAFDKHAATPVKPSKPALRTVNEWDAPVPDAGALARDKLKAKKKVSFFAKVGWFLLFLIFAALGSIGYGLHYIWTHAEPVNTTYYKTCSIQMGDDYEITGRRNFTFHRLDYGWGFSRQVGEPFQETRIDVIGKPMTILGITGENLVPTNIAPAERYAQLLKRADRYIFIVGSTVKMVKYEDLCK